MRLPEFPKTCERWSVYEAVVPGKTDGNPFDYEIRGTFTGNEESIKVDGFYDGDGIYKVRFMPSYEGQYQVKISGNFSEEVFESTFEVTPATGNNHGPVRVENTYHFAYEDGTPHYSFGTTCYVWNLQTEDLRNQTLETLKDAPFNKIRFCVFPKHYDYNLSDPVTFPYEGTPCDCSPITHRNFTQFGCSFPHMYHDVAPDNDWDLTRFNPAHFRLLEELVGKLRDMDIQADIILFHPYDRWGFSKMTREEDSRYLKYVIARLSAYRNVWWSMANEYDLLKKSIEDWDYLGRFVRSHDPYQHLCSVHNCMTMYDFSKDWITHCSIQRTNLYLGAENTDLWRKTFKKPVVLDEIAYEGNIQHGWGNITGQEMTRRFWEGIVRGGYPGHGETILDRIPTDAPEDHDVKLWWSHGGKLKGESAPRISFLRQVLSEIPNGWRLQLNPNAMWDELMAIPDDPSQEGLKAKDYYLCYYSFMAPMFRIFHFDDETEFEVDVIDTWDMTITHLGRLKGEFTVPLPGKQYMAIRIVKCH